MKMSDKGKRAIRREEGEVLTAYLDVANVWTIGVGSTNRQFAFEGNTITKAQSTALFNEDIATVEVSVNREVKADLTQEMFDALCSFAYNVGSGAFKRSTLLKKLNQGDFVGAANEFPRWNKAGGKVLNGLVKRRERERLMFLSGVELIEREKIETNIEADPVEPPRTLSEPGVQATGSVVAAGTVAELTSSLEPLTPYSETIRWVWLLLSLIAIGFVVWKAKKRD